MKEKTHSIQEWAWSAEKRPISLFSNHNLQEISSKSPILFIGGVHGDEPEGVHLAEEWLRYLKKATEALKPWILIPCINPDGYEKRQRTNGNSVDLNRNFPSKCWTNVHDKDRYFPGRSAGSEPETTAIVDLIKEVNPCQIIHFHSWKPMIVYSNKKAERVARHFSETSKFELKNDIGYPTPGSLGEYAGNDLDIGVICIEEQDEMKVQELSTIFPRFKESLVWLVSLES